MLIRHPLLRVIQRQPPDHFAMVRITRYDRRLARCRLGKGILAEQQTEPAFGPNATMTYDTLSVNDRFYLRNEIDLFGVEQTCRTAEQGYENTARIKRKSGGAGRHIFVFHKLQTNSVIYVSLFNASSCGRNQNG